MSSYIALVYFILGFQLLWEVCSDSQTVFKTKNIECCGNPNYVVNVSCSIKAKNWNNAVAQMDCDFTRTAYNLSGHIQFFKKGYNNRFHPFLVNVQVNVCDLLSKRNYATYGVIMIKVLKRFSNVNHSCPYAGHVMARNLYFKDTDFPVVTLGVYQMDFKFYENFSNGTQELLGHVKLSFEAMEYVQPKKKKLN